MHVERPHRVPAKCLESVEVKVEATPLRPRGAAKSQWIQADPGLFYCQCVGGDI